MLESNMLYIPVDDTVALETDVMNQLDYTANEDVLSPPPKQLMLEHEDISKNNLFLSNNEASIFSPIAAQEINSMMVENGTESKENKRIFECEAKGSSECPTMQDKDFLQLPVEDTLQTDKNLKNLQVLLNVEPEIKRRKRGRPPKNKLRPQVHSENDLKVLTDNKENQVGVRMKRNASINRLISNNSFNAGDTLSAGQRSANKYSMRIKIIKHEKKYEAVLPKSKRKKGLRRSVQKVKSSEKKKTGRRKRKCSSKGRGKLDDFLHSTRLFGSSKSSSTISRLRKKKIDYNNPIFHEPFKYGWRREVVFRAYTKQSRADVYYHSPEGEKLRSFVAIKKKRKYN
jgi:hypothetical protein